MQEKNSDEVVQEKQTDKVKVILDPGSCHMRSMDYCRELIDLASTVKADVIKFQLFPNTKEFTENGNIYLPFDWFTDLFRYGETRGMEVTASVFDHASLNMVAKHAVPFVKFAHSRQRDEDGIKEMLAVGKKVIVTSDSMNVKNVLSYAKTAEDKKDKLIRLWTYTVNGKPEYAYINELNFANLFTGGEFQGFSDHSIGSSLAIKAVKAGAKWIEKHFKLEKRDIKCPDASFAITGQELADYVRAVKEAAQ